MTAGRSPSPHYLVPAEVSLLAVTAATVFGFSRVFETTHFFLPMITVAAYAHAVTWATRRRGISVPTSALIAVAGFLLLLSWIFFASTTLVGIPTPATLTAAQEALTASWESFGSIVAPAPALPGFLMASCAALFFAVFLADWAAFRLWSAFEAIVPASTLFIFCSLLGSPDHKIDTTAIFLATILGFLLVHRVARQESTAGWLTADIDRGSRAALRAGGALIASALVIGVVVGPRLPGADTAALISWRGAESGGGGARITISPLVDIKDRLINQRDVEVFTVESNEKSYWRMTSLDTFEGEIWKSGGKYTSVDGSLEDAFPTQAGTVEADQTFQITNLNVLWVPAAFQPTSVDSSDVDVRYQADSSTLIVTGDRSNSDSMRYRVISAVPRFTADQLGTADTAIPADVRTRFLQLPNDFSPKAHDLAVKAIEGKTTSYEKARALQDYFQDKFEYSTDVQQGHGESAIDDFLDRGTGYCEQFAGTFAAMARSLGIPARVAVGFTPGDQDPNNPNLYHVRGKHAHAWPEVYLGQYGWVPFEPTPTRGAPNSQEWTGRAEQQTGDAAPVTQPTATVTTIVRTPSTIDPASVPPTTAAAAPVTTAAPVPVVPDVPLFDQLSFRLALFGLALVCLAGLYVVAVTSAKDARHRRRRQLARDPSARVRVAWTESIEELALLGTRPRPSETHEEFARRAQPSFDGADEGALLVALAFDVDAAAYAPDQLTDEVAQRAEATRGTVVAAVHAKVTSSRRWRRRLDLRPLLPRRRPSTRRRAASREN